MVLVLPNVRVGFILDKNGLSAPRLQLETARPWFTRLPAWVTQG
jgi:hypothetical protein